MNPRIQFDSECLDAKTTQAPALVTLWGVGGGCTCEVSTVDIARLLRGPSPVGSCSCLQQCTVSVQTWLRLIREGHLFTLVGSTEQISQD